MGGLGHPACIHPRKNGNGRCNDKCSGKSLVPYQGLPSGALAPESVPSSAHRSLGELASPVCGMTGVVCPDCSAPMVARKTNRFRYRDGRPRKFWGCSRWPECKATHGAHPDGRPLGIPADAETKRQRMVVHEILDGWWKSGRMSRKAAYRRLQQLMNMTEDRAHVAKFTKEDCGRFLDRVHNPSQFLPAPSPSADAL